MTTVFRRPRLGRGYGAEPEPWGVQKVFPTAADAFIALKQRRLARSGSQTVHRGSTGRSVLASRSSRPPPAELVGLSAQASRSAQARERQVRWIAPPTPTRPPRRRGGPTARTGRRRGPRPPGGGVRRGPRAQRARGSAGLGLTVATLVRASTWRWPTRSRWWWRRAGTHRRCHWGTGDPRRLRASACTSSSRARGERAPSTGSSSPPPGARSAAAAPPTSPTSRWSRRSTIPPGPWAGRSRSTRPR